MPRITVFKPQPSTAASPPLALGGFDVRQLRHIPRSLEGLRPGELLKMKAAGETRGA